MCTFFSSVCVVYACVCWFSCMWTHMSVQMHGEPDTNVKDVSTLLAILSTEAELLSWTQNLTIMLVPLASWHGESSLHLHTWNYRQAANAVLGLELWPSCLCGKSFILFVHFFYQTFILINKYFSSSLYIIYFICYHHSVREACGPQHIYRCQKTAGRGQFFPSIM